MHITNEKINECLKFIEETQRDDKSYPWKFPNMKIENDDGEEYIYVPECDYLGGTNICLTSNSTGEEGRECLLVQTAIEMFEPLLKEVKQLRHILDVQEAVTNIN